MALEKQIVGIDFTQGLDTQTDERLVVPGKLLTLQNMTFSTNNALSRRDGWAPLVAGTNANGLVVFNNELLAISGSTVSSWSTAKNAFQSVGSTSPIYINKEPVIRDNTFKSHVDCAIHSGMICYVWAEFTTKALTTPAGIYYMVADSTTGAIIKGRTALVISAVSSCPRVAAITETSGASDADCFIVTYVSGVSGLGYLYMSAIPLATLVATSPVASFTNVIDPTVYPGPIDMVSDHGLALVVYAATDVSNNGSYAGHIKYASGAVTGIHQTAIAAGSFNGSDVRGIGVAEFVSSAWAPGTYRHFVGIVHSAVGRIFLKTDV